MSTTTNAPEDNCFKGSLAAVSLFTPPTPNALRVFVCPAFELTLAIFSFGRPKTAFNRLDFPTFERPTKQTSGYGERGIVLNLAAVQRWMGGVEGA